MIVHPSIIVVMGLLYTAEYIWRFAQYRPHNYIYLGKALARALLTAVYLWIWIASPSEEHRSIWIRWSIAMLLGVDLFYIAQEHLMRKIIWK